MANFAQSAASEALAGLVERVTFHNPENGFCVLRVKARGHRDLLTVVGRAALISAGEFVQMSGTWVNDRTHGQQFRASFLKTSPPTTLEGIERYLGSGMIRGIGPIYAKRLVRGFGEAVFDLIEQQPDRLREVAGIGAKRAARIVAGWAEQKVVREIMLFLHANGVGTSRAVRIYKTYGSEAVRVISDNPYRLAQGYPWDRISDRGPDRRAGRDREDCPGADPCRDQLRAGRGDERGTLRLAGGRADDLDQQAAGGIRRLDRNGIGAGTGGGRGRGRPPGWPSLCLPGRPLPGRADHCRTVEDLGVRQAILAIHRCG